MADSSLDPEDFASRLRATRKARGLSQDALTERTRIKQPLLSDYETGRRVPNSPNLKKLADTLSVTTDFLLGREQVDTPAGPAASYLFQDFSKLSAIDQDRVADYVRMLAGTKKGGKK